MTRHGLIAEQAGLKVNQKLISRNVSPCPRVFFCDVNDQSTGDENKHITAHSMYHEVINICMRRDRLYVKGMNTSSMHY